MYVFDNELRQFLLQIFLFEMFDFFQGSCAPHDMFNYHQSGKYTSIFIFLISSLSFLRL